MDISKFKAEFETDQTAEIEGVEIQVDDDFYIRVARSNNREAAKHYGKLTSDHRINTALKADALSPEEWEGIMLEVRANCILKGWRGLTEGGNPVPYSVEKAKELLRIPDFHRFVIAASEKQENYRVATVAAAKEALGKS